ncbi:DUF1178 family protein [Candidatus Pelagibacter sp.]|nr:DUF1178 family protein [Candidatus Pelagibacter sp.]
MIKYKLVCKDCNNIFDSWFSSSKEYEKLKKRKYLNCHICDSCKIEKALMAPNILNNSELKSKDINKIKEIKSKLREFKKFIKNNFKYVGENFVHEARSIHYDPKKKNKAIYGKASREEIEHLKQEGIKTEEFPWIEDKEN